MFVMLVMFVMKGLFMKHEEIFGIKVRVDDSVKLTEDITPADTRALFSIGQLEFIDNEVYQIIDVAKIWNIHHWQMRKAIKTGYVATGDDGTVKSKKRFRIRPVSNIEKWNSAFRGADLNKYFFLRWLSGKTLQERSEPIKITDSATRLSKKDIKEFAENFKLWKQEQIDRLNSDR